MVLNLGLEIKQITVKYIPKCVYGTFQIGKMTRTVIYIL